MKYKETGIEWFGIVPQHWKVNKLSLNVPFKTGFTPSTSKSEFYGGEHNWVTIDDLNGGIVTNTKTRLSNLGIDGRKGKLIKKGSLFYSFKLTVGKVGFAGEDMYTNEAIASFEPNDRIDINFLYYSFSDYLLNNAKENIYGAQLLNSELIKNSKILVPPKKEQVAIADYLDKACERIDKIIKIKEEQLVSLDEYKESFIIKVLSEGFNNSKNLIQAESQWFSKYPKHWRVRKIKRYLTLLTDYTANGSFASLAKNVQYLSEGHARIVRLTDLRVDFKNKGVFIDEHAYNFLSKTKLYGGELLIANVGAYTGHLCIMPEVKFKASLAPNMMLFDVNEKLNKKYLYYFLLSKLGQMQFKLNSTITAQPKMNKDQFRKTEILEPPIDEQNKIVEVIENFLTNHESLISSIESQIETLINYRKSLIHECVTGKKQIVKAMETVKN